MEKLVKKLTVPNIIIAFIVLQPMIDMITALSIEYAKVSITIGIIVRTSFMIFCVLLGIVKADKKYRIGMSVFYSLLLLYGMSFLINSYLKNGTNLIFFQIRGLVKNFYLPIMLVALVPIFKAYEIKVERNVFVVTLMIYAFIIFICDICGIALPTYRVGGKAGTVGLFHSANEIGAILCLLSPFLVVDFMNRGLKARDIFSFLLMTYAVLQVGTQVPYFGLIILMMMMIFACLIYAKLQKKKKLYKKAGTFFGILIAIYLVTGLTPVGENLTTNYGNIFLINRKDIHFQNQQQPKIEEVNNLEDLTTMVVSSRTEYLRTNQAKFMKGSLADKLLGISFVENENGISQELKLTEMDYFDILFCNGILGTLLFVIPVLTYGIRLVVYIIKNRKKVGLEQIYFVVMTGAVALLAGHVLVSPAVSIYIAIVLLSYEIEMKQNQDKEETWREEKNEKNNHISTTSINRGNREGNCYIK